MFRLSTNVLLSVTFLFQQMAIAQAVDFEFFGRSGDLIEIDFSRVPGVGPGASFAHLQTPAAHTVLTSDDLGGGPFSESGLMWFAPNNNPSARGGNTNPNERGYQGTINGSITIDGVLRTYAITVQPGYTGAGRGAVQQSLEGLNRNNTPLYVAQQQQRLNYFGFVGIGSVRVATTGVFDNRTDEALRTFQAAFVGGLNTGQNNVDGIIGPNTVSWLNAANAPKWERLIDPDPPQGMFSVNNMVGDFDILPGRDPGTGIRTGQTPQFEDHGTSWSLEIIRQGSAAARAATGRTQLINAISAPDGYGSACCHNTHRAGMDIDLHVDNSTWNYGNGVLDFEESLAVQHALAFIDNAAPHGRVSRIITSNQDILNAIRAQRPNVIMSFDSSGVHLNHLHIDIAPPPRQASEPEIRGDFNLDGVVDAADIDQLRRNFGGNPDIYHLAGRIRQVDQFDLNELVHRILDTQFGDANLDRRIDHEDAQRLLDHLGGGSGKGWNEGDFVGDGRVTASGDGSILLRHWGFDGNTGTPSVSPGNGQASATWNPGTGKLHLQADQVSLIVLRSNDEPLGPVEPIAGFNGSGHIDDSVFGELAWINFDDAFEGSMALNLDAAPEELTLWYQVRGGELTAATMVVVPEPTAMVLIVFGLASLLPLRRLRS